MFDRNMVITKITSVLEISTEKDRFSDYSGKLKNNELIFKFEGISEIKYGEQAFHEVGGNIRFLPKTDIHTKYEVTTLEASCCIDIIFETDTPIKQKPFCISTIKHKELSRLFKKTYFLWRTKPAGYEYFCIGLLYEILALLQADSSYISSAKYNKIKIGVDFINENFNKQINLNDASKSCNLSYAYFKRLFIKAFDMPPKAYIMQMRINYAIDLLKTNRYTITEIAEFTGFSNVYYFSRAFKKQIGFSPSEFISLSSQ